MYDICRIFAPEKHFNKGKSLPQVRTGMEKDLPVQAEDVVGGTAVHEATHVTDEKSNAALNPDSNNREKAPVNIETQIYKELDQLKILLSYNLIL